MKIPEILFSETFGLDTYIPLSNVLVFENVSSLNFQDFSIDQFFSGRKKYANENLDDFKDLFDFTSLKIFTVIISFLTLILNTTQQIILIKVIHR